MIAIGIVLSIFGLGFLCWILFQFAVYALPVFAAMSVGLSFHQSGARPIASIALGVGVGVATLVIGQFALALVRVLWLRALIALLFAAPAAAAGYSAMYGIASLTLPSEGWRTIFSIGAAIVVGITAWVRMAAMDPDRPGCSETARG